MRKYFNYFIFLFFQVSLLNLVASNITPGQKLYEQKCGRCHTAYPANNYSMAQWQTILKDMGPRSGLDKDSEAQILVYLEKESKKKQSKSFPTSPVLGGYIYTEFFSSPASTDTFDIHYLNLNISGRLHDRVTYKAEFELEHGGGKDEPPFVEQAYLDLWLLKNSALRIGAMLTPFNRFDDFHGPLENLLITRPKMAREIGVSAWKEVGIDWHGSLSLHKDFYLNYDFYIINGLGSGSRLRSSRQYRDNNDAKSFGIRLSGVILDKVEFGASFYQGSWDDEGQLKLSLFGLHLLAKFGNLNLFAEWAKFSSENPELIEDGRADGYFLQASYLLGNKFRPTIRYGTIDYIDNGNLLGRSPTDYDSMVLAVGFNFYLTPAIVFKFEYDFIMEGGRESSSDNNLLALQAAVRF